MLLIKQKSLLIVKRHDCILIKIHDLVLPNKLLELWQPLFLRCNICEFNKCLLNPKKDFILGSVWWFKGQQDVATIPPRVVWKWGKRWPWSLMDLVPIPWLAYTIPSCAVPLNITEAHYTNQWRWTSRSKKPSWPDQEGMVKKNVNEDSVPSR